MTSSRHSSASARFTRSDSNNETGLSRHQIDTLRRRLEQQRHQTLESLAQHQGRLIEPLGALPDEMDEAAHEQDRGFLLGRVEKERELLDELDAALARITVGTYGICEGLGTPIGLRRLEARPHTRFSVEFMESVELKDRTLRRR